eukprot:15032772-Alexandrium_andersonii.AAC.1
MSESFGSTQLDGLEASLHNCGAFESAIVKPVAGMLTTNHGSEHLLVHQTIWADFANWPRGQPEEATVPAQPAGQRPSLRLNLSKALRPE